MFHQNLAMFINYFTLKSLFMISARDVLALARTFFNPDGSIDIVTSSVTHDKAPKPDTGGYVRADLKFGGNILTPIDANTTRVTYLLASDPRGLIDILEFLPDACSKMTIVFDPNVWLSSSGSIPGWAVALANTKQPLCVATIRNFIAKNRKKLEAVLPEVFSRLAKEHLSFGEAKLIDKFTVFLSFCSVRQCASAA